jgi:hypothetical protein
MHSSQAAEPQQIIYIFFSAWIKVEKISPGIFGPFTPLKCVFFFRGEGRMVVLVMVVGRVRSEINFRLKHT